MKDKEKRAEEMLQMLGNEMSKERFRHVQELSELEQTDNVDFAIVSGTAQKTQRKTGRGSTKRLLRACAIILCVLIGATAVTTSVSEAFRAKVFGFFRFKSSNIRSTGFWNSSSSSLTSMALTNSMSVAKFCSSVGAS